MADFLKDLWESIFTSGPTPTLLLATNATFAALQLTLAILLIATYSVHFAILSVLSGGLWYAINWFARELTAAQAKEEEAERLRKKRRESDRKGSREAGNSADDEGEDTEVEGGMTGSKASLSGFEDEAGVDERVRQEIVGAVQKSGGKTSGVKVAGGGEQARQRARQRDGDMSGELSTDSEWEKVDEGQLL